MKLWRHKSTLDVLNYLHSIVSSINNIDELVSTVDSDALWWAEHANSTALLPDRAVVFTILCENVYAVLPFVWKYLFSTTNYDQNEINRRIMDMDIDSCQLKE